MRLKASRVGRTSQRQSNRFRNSVSSDYAFFAKDDYKIRPDLTLNLGVCAMNTTLRLISKGA